ncbi:hypothetical protein RDMS_05870, partial [Deinococcus sp. RL]|uniref:GAF domain-containing protein n=1 Tax=Deinococcus sp. RL TaxID=1489678 RepID=UPI0004D924F5
MVRPPTSVPSDRLLAAAEAFAEARHPAEVLETLLAQAYAALRVPVAVWWVPETQAEYPAHPTAQVGEGAPWPDEAALRAVWPCGAGQVSPAGGVALLPFWAGEGGGRGLLGVAWPQPPGEEERCLARQFAAQAAWQLGQLARGGRRDALEGLARAALRLGQATGLRATLEVIAEEAHTLVGAQQAALILTAGEDGTPPITVLSPRDEGAAEHGAELLTPTGGDLTVPLLGRDGRTPLGLLRLRDRGAGAFSPEDERLLTPFARLAAATLEQARSLEAAQAEVQRREQAELQWHVRAMELEGRIGAATHELQTRAAALDAFVAFSEAVGTQTDVTVLAEQAIRVLRTTLGHVGAGYYEPEGRLWRAQVWSDDLAPELVAQIRAGLPADLPPLAQALASGEAVFVDGWDGEAHALPSTRHYGAGAFVPVAIGGEVRSLLAVGTRAARCWTEQERTVMRAVGRSFQLALERAEATALLERQNVELAARTRALEAFAHLTGDLAAQSDPRVFVRRAQEVMLSLLPPGYALYYEQDGERWRNRVQVGDVRNAALQAFIDAGPRVGQTPSVDLPAATQQPYYQDAYARGSDTPQELVQHVSTVASLPVLRRGEVVGVLVAAMFEGRPWSRTDRIILETVVSHLGLALERAESVALLAERTAELEQANAELERSNAELEQFAYVASHDLQAPIRAMTSFAELIGRRYGEQLDERGRKYLGQIITSGEHMKRLVDDLLAFSRVHTAQREPEVVDASEVFDTVRRRLQAAQGAGAQVTRGALPRVLADPYQLDQLFQNLLTNGLKYRREGVEPSVHVWAQREGERWRFAVRDNGIGIERQYWERIFVIFQRLHGRE